MRNLKRKHRPAYSFSRLGIAWNFGLSLVAGCLLASTKPANPAVFTQRLTASTPFNKIRTTPLACRG